MGAHVYWNLNPQESSNMDLLWRSNWLNVNHTTWHAKFVLRFQRHSMIVNGWFHLVLESLKVGIFFGDGCLYADCISCNAELKLRDDPTVTINVVCIKSTLTHSFSYPNIFQNQSPVALQGILYHTVKASEQTKPVLYRLGRAKVFLQTIMKLGAVASEVSSLCSCEELGSKASSRRTLSLRHCSVV